MPKLINFDLISHPMNWVTVGFMTLIAGIFISLLLQWQGVSSPANSSVPGAQ